jgi:hypothetical protein
MRVNEEAKEETEREREREREGKGKEEEKMRGVEMAEGTNKVGDVHD